MNYILLYITITLSLITAIVFNKLIDKRFIATMQDVVHKLLKKYEIKKQLMKDKTRAFYE